MWRGVRPIMEELIRSLSIEIKDQQDLIRRYTHERDETNDEGRVKRLQCAIDEAKVSLGEAKAQLMELGAKRREGGIINHGLIVSGNSAGGAITVNHNSNIGGSIHPHNEKFLTESQLKASFGDNEKIMFKQVASLEVRFG